jgi:hypothetical protein
MFLASVLGQILTGFNSYSEILRDHQISPFGMGEYLFSGHFLEALFENWESEFLQMAIYVVMTSFLFQKGSSESNPLPGEPDPKSHYRKKYFLNHPWLRKLYECSLSIALFVLFFISFAGHAYGGLKHQNFERKMHQKPEIEMSDFISGSDFWFQSFQNWQSEFLSVSAMVVMSIFLRQKGSAQSKEVDAPHFRTEG